MLEDESGSNSFVSLLAVLVFINNKFETVYIYVWGMINGNALMVLQSKSELILLTVYSD